MKSSVSLMLSLTFRGSWHGSECRHSDTEQSDDVSVFDASILALRCHITDAGDPKLKRASDLRQSGKLAGATPKDHLCIWRGLFSV